MPSLWGWLSASAAQHHQLLGVCILEAELPIEAGTLGVHQIHPLLVHDGWGIQQCFDLPAAQAMALQISGDDVVLELGPAEAHHQR